MKVLPITITSNKFVNFDNKSKHNPTFMSQGNDEFVSQEKQLPWENSNKKTDNFVMMLYNKLLPPKIRKEKSPKIDTFKTKDANSGFKEPKLEIGYERILNDLNSKKKLNKEWVKENLDLFRVLWGLNLKVKIDDTRCELFSDELNRNRKIYINQTEEKYTEEKATYIKEIWPNLMTTNKEKNIAGLEAIEKYGTRPDIDKLDISIQLSKDDDIAKAFCKAVEKHGDATDARHTINLLDIEKDYYKTNHNLKADTTEQVLKSTLALVKKGDIKLYYGEEGYREAVAYQVNNKNPKISELAKEILEHIPDKYID